MSQQSTPKSKKKQYKAVTQYLTAEVSYNREEQEYNLGGCTQKIFIESFWGQFELFDEAKRSLGKSEKGSISFLKKDLQTEAAKVWYDATTHSSAKYKLLQDDYNIEDPGLDFAHMPKVYLKFLEAPESDMWVHTHIFANIYNIWSPSKKCMYDV